MSGFFPVVVHHNPKCGTSRSVLEAVKSAGYEPQVVEYLKTGWTRPQLLALFAAAGMTPREALRAKEQTAKDMGLLEEGVSDAALIDAMVEHPVLVERPIVASPKGVRLCRPAETVQELLDR